MNGDMSPYTIRIFCQTNFSQEAIRLTAGDGGPSTSCQTHSNASSCFIKASISTTPPVEIRMRVLSTQGLSKPCLILISNPPPKL